MGTDIGRIGPQNRFKIVDSLPGMALAQFGITEAVYCIDVVSFIAKARS